METIRFSYKNIPNLESSPLCLGNFDGVHRGHQHLLAFSAVNYGEFSVLLFTPTYSELFADKTVLTSIEDKLRYFSLLRVNKTLIMEVDEEFYRLEKKEFITILKKLNPAAIICGKDFSFGKQKSGNIDDLKPLFRTDVVDEFILDGEKVSSSKIREMLLDGHIEEANKHLGHPYSLFSKVEKGLGNGRKLGFPTINLSLNANYLLPKHGVYAGIAYLLGLPHKAMINIGTNPTISNKLDNVKIEANLLNYSGDCYGNSVYLDLLYFERNEQKFPSFEELANRLIIDQLWAEQVLSEDKEK